METKFESYLKEAISINFKNEWKNIKIKAANDIVDLLKKDLVGRLVGFYTTNFIDEDFKGKVSTSHNAIMNIEDVFYRHESKNPYCTGFLVSSFDRKHYGPYYDINPSGPFYFIDTFLEDFENKYIGEKISFSPVYGRMYSHLEKKPVICTPVSIKVKLDGLHQEDTLVITDTDGKKWNINYKNPIFKIHKNQNPFDPYNEESWG